MKFIENNMDNSHIIQPQAPNEVKTEPEKDGEVTQGNNIDFESDYRVVDILDFFHLFKEDLSDKETNEKMKEIYKTIIPFGNDYMVRLRDMAYNLGHPEHGSKLDQIYYFLMLKKQENEIKKELAKL